jgi:Plasmid pRiA4b ORF-3-like protein
MSSPVEIARLKIALDHVKPTVMRRIEVPVSIPLDALHEAIQAIMPWDNYHMYAFYLRLTDDVRWGLPPPEDLDFGMHIRDSRVATLGDVLAMPGFKLLRYTYDFGDDWRHTIKVERRFAAEPWEDYPRLVDAKGRCPPEDIGGPWGYADYLDAMSDPAHKRHAELVGWLGRRDPNAIDRGAMEAALARVAGTVPAGTPRRKRGRPRS